MTYRNFLLPVMGALVMTVSGFAQTGVEARVPFDFHVGKAVFPAGTYRVKFGEPAGAVLVRSMEGKGAAIVITNGLSPAKEQVCRLVFHQYGNVFYLNQVWGPDGGGRQLIPTAAEQETAMAAVRRARIDVAANIHK